MKNFVGYMLHRELCKKTVNLNKFTCSKNSINAYVGYKSFFRKKYFV